MDFALLPPEVNSGRIYVGPGSGPMLAAAAAWDGLATELHSAATSYGSVIWELSGGPWLGAASAAMTTAVAPYMAWMRSTAIQAEQTAIQAKGAAAAYEVTFAAMVPPPVIAANRALLQALVATNLFGQNTPAIAATEALYAEMWAQDATAMYGYAGVSASATTLTPFTPAPQSVNPSGLGGQAAALAQGTATSAATNTQTMLAQLTSAVPTALKGLASPSSFTSAAGLPGGLLASLQSLAASLSAIPPETIFSTALESTDVGLGSSGLLTSTGAWADAAQDDDAIHDTAREWREQFKDRINGLEGQIMTRFDQLGAVGSAGSARLGQAASVGALSVPSGWTAAAPAMKLAAVALPATSLGVAPEVFASSPASLFTEMTLANMAGRAISRATTTPGRQEPIGSMSRARPASTATSASRQMTATAADIREFADVLVKLGDLRDSGLLTDEEFTEQKERLLAH
jgi:PPE-repeat protein